MTFIDSISSTSNPPPQLNLKEFFEAVAFAYEEIVQKGLKQFDPSVQDVTSEIAKNILIWDHAPLNALGFACLYRADDIIDLLLNHVKWKETLNQKGSHGRKIIHIVVQEEKCTKLIKKLLDAGANPDEFDDLGLTPLNLASITGKTVAVEILLKHEAKKIGVTPLKATLKCYLPLVLADLVVEYSPEPSPIINLNLPPKKEKPLQGTPLFHAVYFKKPEELVHLLLAYKANPLQKFFYDVWQDRTEMTIIEIARKRSASSNVIQMLENAANEIQETPIS